MIERLTKIQKDTDFEDISECFLPTLTVYP